MPPLFGSDERLRWSEEEWSAGWMAHRHRKGLPMALSFPRRCRRYQVAASPDASAPNEDHRPSINAVVTPTRFEGRCGQRVSALLGGAELQAQRFRCGIDPISVCVQPQP